jgi:hypothetical protein
MNAQITVRTYMYKLQRAQIILVLTKYNQCFTHWSIKGKIHSLTLLISMKDLQLPDQSPCSITGLQFLNNIIWAFDVNSRESSIIEQQNIISDYSFTFLVAMKSQIQSWSFHYSWRATKYHFQLQLHFSCKHIWFLVDSSNQISTIPSTLEFVDNLLRQQIHTLPLSCIDWRKWPDIYCGMSNSCDRPSQPTPTLSNGNGSVL